MEYCPRWLRRFDLGVGRLPDSAPTLDTAVAEWLTFAKGHRANPFSDQAGKTIRTFASCVIQIKE
jgi:hypothetical protein